MSLRFRSLPLVVVCFGSLVLPNRRWSIAKHSDFGVSLHRFRGYRFQWTSSGSMLWERCVQFWVQPGHRLFNHEFEHDMPKSVRLE